MHFHSCTEDREVQARLVDVPRSYLTTRQRCDGKEGVAEAKKVLANAKPLEVKSCL